MLLQPENPTKRFFEKFGRSMTIESPTGTVTCKAFLQPLRVTIFHLALEEVRKYH